ncbi:MAG: response regulator [Desulfobacteraceae bacterium]|nr:response regulator [Desulfobacteraceae bacterium]
MEPEQNIILIIDDSVNNIKLVSDFLKEAGFTTAVAKSGLKGFARAKKLKPSLILLDIMMPEMDGYEVCRKLKANDTTKDIPVIFMTALVEAEDKIRAFLCGGVDYIIKPVEQWDVLARVAAHVKIRNQAIAIESARQSAVATNQAKTEFLINMSHELRAPLNSIMGYAWNIRKSVGDRKLQHGLDVIQESGRHLLSIVDDILDLIMVESGRTDLSETEFDFLVFLRNLCDIIQVQAEQKGLSFKFEISKNFVPAVVRADERRLRQVLLNLFSNAVKYTDKGSVTFRIIRNDTSASDASCANLCFEVEDTGKSIPKEYHSLVFEPFHAGRQKKGTGLGLAITRNLVEIMGGKLGLKTLEPRGNIFYFELILPELFPVRQHLENREEIIGIKGKPLEVLVLDKNPLHREVIIDMLSPLGFMVTESRGLAEAKDCQTDIIIIDPVMNETDGLELIRNIRDYFPETVIIASSASVYEKHTNKSVDAGCNAFLPKPVDPHLLFNCLQELLNLEWIYKESWDEDDQTETGDIIVPDSKDLKKLLKLLENGAVTEIEDQAKRLENAGPNLKPFLETLCFYVEKLMLDEAKMFIRQYMK